MEHSVERDTRQAIVRGFSQVCPRCGKGHVFNGYLSVAATCDACGLDLTPQRADDGPAYLTIAIVGHLLMPLLVPAYRAWDVHPAIMASVFSALAIVLSLLLLPRLKGAIVGF